MAKIVVEIEIPDKELKDMLKKNGVKEVDIKEPGCLDLIDVIVEMVEDNDFDNWSAELEEWGGEDEEDEEK